MEQISQDQIDISNWDYQSYHICFLQYLYILIVVVFECHSVLSTNIEILMGGNRNVAHALGVWR